MVQLKRSIVLVGLMGAGKTSVGRRLSELLDVEFHDSDTEIEAVSAGMTVPEIFEKYGEEEFRRLERGVLKRLLAEKPAVLATGGGAFMNDETRTEIAKAALSVWLSVDLDTLWTRVGNRPGRPLLETHDPFSTLKQLFEVRAPVYALADLTVPSGRRDNQDAVARDVIRAVAELGRLSPDEAVFDAEDVAWITND